MFWPLCDGFGPTDASPSLKRHPTHLVFHRQRQLRLRGLALNAASRHDGFAMPLMRAAGVNASPQYSQERVLAVATRRSPTDTMLTESRRSGTAKLIALARDDKGADNEPKQSHGESF